MSRLVVIAAALVEIRRTSQAAFPEEGCGYLIGKPATSRVHAAKGTANVHPGPRHSRYLMDPLEFMRLEEQLEQKGEAILGIFHSHPSSPAVPSATDLAHALPDLYYVVHDMRNGASGPMRAWRLNETTQAFDEIPIQEE